MTIRGLLFDVDNTLIDTSGAMLDGARSALRDALGADHEDMVEAGAAIWVNDAQGRYEAYVAGELTFVQQRRLRVADLYRALGRTEPDQEGVAAWLAAYRAAQLHSTVLFDDVLPCLSACTGLPVVALSNNDGAWQRERLGHVGLGEAIGTVLGISDVGVAKPHPAMYRAGCAALDLAPDEVACVGDSIVSDAQGAAEAGLRGIWLDRLNSEPAPAGLERITSLLELAGVLGVEEADAE